MPTCPPSCPLSCPRTGGGAKYGFEAMSELLRLPVRHGQGDTERRTWVAARAKGGDGRLEQNERLRETLEVSAAEALSREDLDEQVAGASERWCRRLLQPCGTSTRMSASNPTALKRC